MTKTDPSKKHTHRMERTLDTRALKIFECKQNSRHVDSHEEKHIYKDGTIFDVTN